ncbi:MAG: alpha/beta hydrolase [Bacteroidota bacterium]
MKNVLKWFAVLIVLLVVAYWLGPAPAKPKLDAQLPRLTASLVQLEQDINASERSQPDVKPNNQARIVWADSSHKQKTRYSILYLHGFSASQEEGAPVHTNIARRFGCNLYLSRLEDHGTQHPDVFLKLTPENMLASANRALAIASQLGDSVIVMGTSNGGALGLFLTANQPQICALIAYSPAVALYNPTAILLDKPWGLQIARVVMGSDYSENKQATQAVQQYWSNKYRVEGLVTLQSFLDNAMIPETFQRIHCPVFLAYYYKNEEEQDKVVSVPAMLEMFDQLGTPPALKRKEAFPKTGEHVIASHLRSKDWKTVEQQTIRFLEEVMKLQPKSAESISATAATIPYE